MNNPARSIYILLIAIVSVVILIYAQGIIIPFILAILFWFLIRVIKKILSKSRYIRILPTWLITVISTLLLLTILVLVVDLLSNNIQQLSLTLPKYEKNVTKIAQQINSAFEIDVFDTIKNISKDYNFSNLLSSLFTALTGIFGDAFTVLLYLVFLLIEEPIFPKKLRAMYPDDDKYEHIRKMIDKIDHSVGNYVALKTVVSIITGVLSYVALLFIGVDAPLFWAFLIFILNFIPTIGSLIATTFPAFFALLQFGEFTPAILVLSIVGAIQLVMGNFVEPKFMGDTLNISPLVVFLTLALWGVMWGITGMLLSVPITVILIIILAEFPASRPIAILLSQKGWLKE